jgi:predicted protein tyrosine phosphatase
MASVFFLVVQAMACVVVDWSSPWVSMAPVPGLGLALFCVCWPVVIVVMDETVKQMDQKRFAKLRKRRRIQFDTKLGMWSPR